MHPHWTNPAYANTTLRDLEIRRDALKDICMDIERQLFDLDIEIFARGLSQMDARQ
jgi:hypothetical protein